MSHATLRALTVPAPALPHHHRPHLYSRPVRMSDLDPMNHVNNVRLLEMIQDAHVDLFYLQRGHPGQPGQPAGQAVRVRVIYARHELDYTEALDLRPEPAVISTTVSTVRRSSFELTSRITRGDQVFCTCVSTCVAYDPAARRTRRLEDDELAVLARHATCDCLPSA
ncbi:acyl-CoA thioesterase [Streptomyces fuscichromogenes]|uniref:Thioesterase n=1 Tax=Streptomyces fuscichromogenes TaxID=1324013 RepID=A0A917XE63_9ACTN|nr:thioesterase family protein [Streptomyces fuscichromogenes]GGN14845.1 thioesterase [Streptomyces fuscichromogenes]